MTASDEVISNKKKNKKTSVLLKADVKRLLKEAEIIASQTLELDYISPEVILMTFFDEDHCPRVVKRLLPEDEKEANKLIIKIVTECTSVVADLGSLGRRK